MSDFPRRNQMLKWTSAEHAISKAIDEVERAGCHPLLTDAVVLLQDAKTAVADFVDGVQSQTALTRLKELQDALVALGMRGDHTNSKEVT